VDAVAQLQQPRPQPVMTDHAAFHEAVFDQRGQDAESGRGMQSGGGGQGLEADRFVVNSQNVEQAGYPGNHLNRGSRFVSHSGS